MSTTTTTTIATSTPMSIIDEKKAAAARISIITIPHPAARAPSPIPASGTYKHTHNHSIDILSTIHSAPEDESPPALSPTSSTSTLSPDGKTDLNPFSPFYNPSPTRLSLDASKSESRRMPPPAPITTTTTPTANAYDTDLEAASTPPMSACSLDKSPMKACADENFHCTVWPSARAMKLKKKAMRREKSRYMLCGWMASLGRPTRITIKVIMALGLLAAAVGIAIGISKAVGGGVWRSKQDTNAPLGHGSEK